MNNFFKSLSYALIIIGAINWGLIGFFNFNLVSSLFGEMSIISRIVYILVGLSAFVSIICCYIERKNERY